MELTVEQILANRTSSSLSDEELDVLLRSGYTIDNTAPRRIRSNPELIEYTLRRNPNAINPHDPALIEALQGNPYATKFAIIARLKDAGKEYSHLPTATEFDKAYNNSGPFGGNQLYNALVLLDRLNTQSMNPKERISALESFYIACGNVREEQSQKYLLEELKQSNIGARELPDEFLALPGVAASRLKFWESNKAAAIEQIFQTQGFNPEAEAAFLRTTNCSSIEEYVAANVANPGRKDSDIVQLAAIRLYTYKKLHEQGIDDIDVVLNSYDILDPKTTGRFEHQDNRRPSIEVNVRSHLPCNQILKIMLHEAEHAIQDHNITNANIDKDADIDTYAKDHFLSSHDPQYYEDNYRNISFEYDAEFRAELENRRLKEKGAPAPENKNLFEMLRSRILSIASRERSSLSQIQSNVARRYSLVRKRKDENGSLDTLDNLFEKKLNEELANGNYEEIMKELNERYPILTYQYNITPQGATKKTPQELIEGLDGAKDEKEIAIYTGLIRSSMNIQKDSNAEKNMERYQGLLDSPSLPLDVRRTIKDSLAAAKSQDKYKGLVETQSVGRSA